MKTAIITGGSGQDAFYLSRLLNKKGYYVYATLRRLAKRDISELPENVEFIEYDLHDGSNINNIISRIHPDEFYNLAAQSHVGTSFSQPEYTSYVSGISVLKILEAIRQYSPDTKFYQASTSELFGDAPAPQNENTSFRPRSPYAAAKAYAHFITKVYRESYGIFACAAILGNHESPKRSTDFVTRKITNHFFKLKTGQRDETLKLGCLDSKRDWGAAPDYVYAMYKIMQLDKPDDFVIGTGETHSVREFCELAYSYTFPGDKIRWGKNMVTGLEKGYNNNGGLVIEQSPSLYRPAEVPLLLMDSSKAKNKLNWSPKTDFHGLVKWMVDGECDTNVYPENKADYFETLEAASNNEKLVGVSSMEGKSL
jgi:GDPmannose 4,6-dehydratase